MARLVRRWVAIALLSIASAAACAAHMFEGQVVVVEGWTLFIRTDSGEPVSFLPFHVEEEGKRQPAMFARTMLPALESGEKVRVAWMPDEREGCRRIDALQVISAQKGTLKGIVDRVSDSELVVRPKDEPGTVTLNPRSVNAEAKEGGKKVGELVPDPAITAKLRKLKKGAKVTVDWAWDKDWRKKIDGLKDGW